MYDPVCLMFLCNSQYLYHSDCSVEASFLDQLKAYLTSDVSADVDSMSTPCPSLDKMKQIFTKDCLSIHTYVYTRVCVCVCVCVASQATITLHHHVARSHVHF